MLPDSKLAPNGGLKIHIIAGINPNTMNHVVLRSGSPIEINRITVIIPEGKNSIDYQITMVNYYKIDDKEFKPWYAVMFTYGYMKDGKIQSEGYFYDGPIDATLGNQENIDYTFENYDESWFN